MALFSRKKDSVMFKVEILGAEKEGEVICERCLRGYYHQETPGPLQTKTEEQIERLEHDVRHYRYEVESKNTQLEAAAKLRDKLEGRCAELQDRVTKLAVGGGETKD